ncbi:hypothetical protein HYV80_06730 [Candidatus Woesearchaeota archaeon]|nr:hypothetical protein [Candidatus Woesearchaeota archaeon]
MAKTYSELEAWGIFAGALIIGVVLTSVFWAFITIPEEVKKIEKEIKNASEAVSIEAPDDFIIFCRKVDGTADWDNFGFRQCIVDDSSEKNLIVMNLLCKKFNLSLSYGSFGVKCEGKA